MRFARKFLFVVAGLVAIPALAIGLDVPVGQGPDGDWPFLARFRDANVSASKERNAARVVFMGDSITEGWANQPAMAATKRYAMRGISGQTTSQMLVRFRSDVIGLKPAVVHIMAGTNDIAGNTGPISDDAILGNIASMVELARAHRIRVVLAAIPPADRFWWRPELKPAARIAAFNKRLRAYATREHITFVDYGQVLGRPDGSMNPQYGPDGVHPNAAGYAVMQPLMQAALRTALAKPVR